MKNFLNGYAVEDISISKKSRHGRYIMLADYLKSSKIDYDFFVFTRMFA